MPLLIKQIAHGSAAYAAAINLRRAILRTPLGLDFTSAQLAAEVTDTQLGVFSDNELVATAVLTPYDASTIKLRQMAVSDEVQGQNIGSQLLTSAEQKAREMGHTQIVLAARVTAQTFYEKNGYTPEGGIFTEVTIPHIQMRKVL